MPAAEHHARLATEYLARQLGTAAPQKLTLLGEFDEGPLEGEGRVSIFSFRASLGGNPAEPYFVVAGETEPNYYPSWNLSPDEMYSLHLGTRFMLVLEIGQLNPGEVPPALEQDTRQALAAVASRAAVSDFRMVAAFGMEGQKHAVIRCRISGQETYVLAADLPLGIYQRVDLPPHVVYRLHLGNVIRRERPEQEEA